MYRPVKSFGDTIAVPQLLFSKLTAPGSDDGRFRVFLYLLSCGEGDAAELSKALHMRREDVAAALNYWEGAGLLMRDPEAAAPDVAALQKRKKMTTREVVQAGKKDPTLGFLLDELQRLFGAVIGESDVNLFVTLYVQDGYPADLILLAASEAAANDAKRARYVEKILGTWRQAGIHDCAAADRHLKLHAERTRREKELARRMGLQGADPFTYADKKKIATWFEDYAYDYEMIDTARMAAGDKASDVKYLHGVLKKWHGQGHQTARDVTMSGESANMRAMRNTVATASADDILMNGGDYVPMKKRSGQ